MQRIKMEQKGRKVTITEGTINQSKLYFDDDGYTVHTGENVNRRDWHMMLIQLLGRGYTSSEAYTEIRKRGIAPKGENTMYNFLRDFKKETGLKFRVDEMTQKDVDQLRDSLDKSAAIPRNVTEKGAEKMAKFPGYSAMLSRREKSGRPFKGEKREKDPYKFTKEDISLLKKLGRR